MSELTTYLTLGFHHIADLNAADHILFLLALAVHLRAARELAETDLPRARAMLEEVSAEMRTALENVRDLAHGIYPPLLAARGLRQGLREAASRALVPARVEADGIGRYPPQV